MIKTFEQFNNPKLKDGDWVVFNQDMCKEDNENVVVIRKNYPYKIFDIINDSGTQYFYIICDDNKKALSNTNHDLRVISDEEAQILIQVDKFNL